MALFLQIVGALTLFLIGLAGTKWYLWMRKLRKQFGGDEDGVYFPGTSVMDVYDFIPELTGEFDEFALTDFPEIWKEAGFVRLECWSSVPLDCAADDGVSFLVCQHIDGKEVVLFLDHGLSVIPHALFTFDTGRNVKGVFFGEQADRLELSGGSSFTFEDKPKTGEQVTQVLRDVRAGFESMV